MNKQYIKPTTKVIELTNKNRLLAGSMKVRGGGYADDIGYGGGDYDYEYDPD